MILMFGKHEWIVIPNIGDYVTTLSKKAEKEKNLKLKSFFCNSIYLWGFNHIFRSILEK